VRQKLVAEVESLRDQLERARSALSQAEVNHQKEKEHYEMQADALKHKFDSD
jgi:hypothetical protein